MVCPNCKGVLDESGKCIACGTVTKMKLEEGGVITNEIPDELIINKLVEIGNINASPIDDIKEAIQKINDAKKLPSEQLLIDGCAHCVDANGNKVICNKNGVNTERFSIVCRYCSQKEHR